VEIRSPSYIEQAYALLSDYHYARGDYRTSRDELQSSRQWADTVHHNLEANRLLESRIQYETVGYTRRIEELDELNRERAARQTAALFMIAPVIVALILISLYSYNRRRLSTRQARELKNLERMRSNFFTNITHEFRTPLTMILGYSGRLRDKFERGETAGPEDVENLGEINRSGGTLLNLVNELLEFARSEAGVNKLKWRRGDMVTFLRSAAEPWERVAQAKGVNLTVGSQTKELEMNYAPEPVKKVIGNLLSNAIRHTPPGHRIEMFMRPGERRGSVVGGAGVSAFVITVRDDGEGIAPGNLPHIFELYYTSHAGGSGIGLALSKQLVEEMGGTIRVESAPGRGAEFTVTLPVSLAEIPGDQLAGQGEDPGLLQPSGLRDDADADSQPSKEDDRPTILVVEDNRDMAKYPARLNIRSTCWAGR
jgi:signal transduction histidine kinase